jgi:hypothetical protein
VRARAGIGKGAREQDKKESGRATRRMQRFKKRKTRTDTRHIGARTRRNVREGRHKRCMYTRMHTCPVAVCAASTNAGNMAEAAGSAAKSHAYCRIDTSGASLVDGTLLSLDCACPGAGVIATGKSRFTVAVGSSGGDHRGDVQQPALSANMEDSRWEAHLSPAEGAAQIDGPLSAQEWGAAYPQICHEQVSAVVGPPIPTSCIIENRRLTEGGGLRRTLQHFP